MAGGLARIPTIDTTSVPTPNIGNRPRPALLDTPVVQNPLAEAVKSIGQDGTQITNILRIQQRQKNVLDGAEAGANYKTDADNVLGTIKQQYSPDQWIAQGQKALGDLTTKYTGDPANEHIGQYLAGHLPKLQQQMLGGLTIDALHQTAVTQDNQTKLMGKQMADEAGGSADPNQQAAIRAGFLSRLQAMRPNDPTWQATHMQAYDIQEVQKRALSIAVNDPTHIGDFIKGLQPGALDGTQQMAAISLANNTMTQAHKQLDINQGQAEANAVTYQQQQIQKTGHPDMPKLVADHEAGIIGDKAFANVAGRPYEVQTSPAKQGVVEHAIEGLGSVDDAHMLKANIDADVKNKEINPGDADRYKATIDKQIEQMKTPAGQANIYALGQIKANYYPTSREDQRWLSRNPGSFSQAAAKAEVIYRSEVYGHPGEPKQFYMDAMQKALKAVPRPGAEAAKTPAPPPPPTDDAVKAAYAAYLKAHPEASP